MNSAQPDSDAEKWQTVVDAERAGERFDAFLSQQVTGISRAVVTQAIRDGAATVDGATRKPAYRLRAGQRIIFAPPAPTTAPSGPEPEDIPLDILYEDESIIAVNKPAAMVVHPAKGHWSGTLTAALAYHFDQLSSVAGATRPGIVHRLDRDTSGVILVAKTNAAHLSLAAQFERRTIEKQYLAIVRNVPDRDRDVIDKPIGVHPYHREKMAIRADHATSRPAMTHFEVAERFHACAVVHAFPKTGRTHQIRVHLAHAGYPVLCDRLYAGHARLTTAEIGQLAGLGRREPTEGAEDAALVIERQALHAMRIQFDHPDREERLAIDAPLADDLQSVIAILRGI